MTFALLLVGGWVLLSFATAAAIVRATLRREPGVRHDPEGASMLRPVVAVDRDPFGAETEPDDGLALVEQEQTVVHVCRRCGHASVSTQEARRAD